MWNHDIFLGLGFFFWPLSDLKLLRVFFRHAQRRHAILQCSVNAPPIIPPYTLPPQQKTRFKQLVIPENTYPAKHHISISTRDVYYIISFLTRYRYRAISIISSTRIPFFTLNPLFLDTDSSPICVLSYILSFLFYSDSNGHDAYFPHCIKPHATLFFQQNSIRSSPLIYILFGLYHDHSHRSR